MYVYQIHEQYALLSEYKWDQMKEILEKALEYFKGRASGEIEGDNIINDPNCICDFIGGYMEGHLGAEDYIHTDVQSYFFELCSFLKVLPDHAEDGLIWFDYCDFERRVEFLEELLTKIEESE